MNLNTTVESEILKAYDAIHSLHVIHGDVRSENILIGKDGTSVWIVDFEFSEILTGADDADAQSRISEENGSVRLLLSGIEHVSESKVTTQIH